MNKAKKIITQYDHFLKTDFGSLDFIAKEFTLDEKREILSELESVGAHIIWAGDKWIKAVVKGPFKKIEKIYDEFSLKGWK